MATDQAEINEFAREISEAVDGLAGDFDRWVAEHPDVDTSLLRAAVDRVKALDAQRPAPETPVDPEPTPSEG